LDLINSFFFNERFLCAANAARSFSAPVAVLGDFVAGPVCNRLVSARLFLLTEFTGPNQFSDLFFYFPDLVISVRLQCTDPSFQSVLRGVSACRSLAAAVLVCLCICFPQAAPLVPSLILGHGNRSISPGRRFL
jgi:hypothetical protein